MKTMVEARLRKYWRHSPIPFFHYNCQSKSKLNDGTTLHHAQVLCVLASLLLTVFRFKILEPVLRRARPWLTSQLLLRQLLTTTKANSIWIWIQNQPESHPRGNENGFPFLFFFLSLQIKESKLSYRVDEPTQIPNINGEALVSVRWKVCKLSIQGE